MTVALDGLIRVGDTSIAALARRSTCIPSRSMIAVHGEKRPVAVLIQRGDETVAYELDGAPMPLTDFDRRYPGIRADFERRSGRQ